MTKANPTGMPVMTMTIRNANPDDLPSIQRIYAESVLNGVATYELVPPGLEEMSERYRSITGSGYPYIVGESGGTIAGYAYASAFRTRAAYRFLVEDSIYIDPQFRGIGLGRMLLDRLVAECTRLGFRQMVAVIGGPHPASIAVHRAAGFESTGRLPGSGWKFGRWLDTELMQLALGEGTQSAPAAGEYPDTLYRG
jgi:L-amino acid N-acyltransferase YncA